MTHQEYWRECVSEAADKCGAILTSEQISEIAAFVQGAHENYGMAFYSPPPSDRISVVEREAISKLERLQKEFDSYRADAETAVKMALRCHPQDAVSIKQNGEVIRFGGRIERVQ